MPSNISNIFKSEPKPAPPRNRRPGYRKSPNSATATAGQGFRPPVVTDEDPYYGRLAQDQDWRKHVALNTVPLVFGNEYPQTDTTNGYSPVDAPQSETGNETEGGYKVQEISTHSFRPVSPGTNIQVPKNSLGNLDTLMKNISSAVIGVQENEDRFAYKPEIPVIPGASSEDLKSSSRLLSELRKDLPQENVLLQENILMKEHVTQHQQQQAEAPESPAVPSARKRDRFKQKIERFWDRCKGCCKPKPVPAPVGIVERLSEADLPSVTDSALYKRSRSPSLHTQTNESVYSFLEDKIGMGEMYRTDSVLTQAFDYTSSESLRSGNGSGVPSRRSSRHSANSSRRSSMMSIDDANETSLLYDPYKFNYYQEYSDYLQTSHALAEDYTGNPLRLSSSGFYVDNSDTSSNADSMGPPSATFTRQEDWASWVSTPSSRKSMPPKEKHPPFNPLNIVKSTQSFSFVLTGEGYNDSTDHIPPTEIGAHQESQTAERRPPAGFMHLLRHKTSRLWKRRS